MALTEPNSGNNGSPTVLVTGAAGLLGRELLKQLAHAGARVRGVDLLPLPTLDGTAFQTGDLLQPEICQRACANVEVIIHAAARQHHSGVPRWGHRQFFTANVEMTRNLVDAALAAGVKHFIFVSSDMVYGLPRGGPLSEDDTPHPIGPYGWSKLACEKVCAAARQKGMHVTVLRPRLIVGPGRLGVLQKLFDRIRAGRSVPIMGSGGHRYQMVAVSDVAAACLLAMRRPLDDVFNLGSHDPPPVRTLLTDLCARAGSPSTTISLPNRLACAALHSLHAVRMAPLNPEQFRIAGIDYVLDTSRAGRQLGWQPQQRDADMLWSAYETYVKSSNGHAAVLESSHR